MLMEDGPRAGLPIKNVTIEWVNVDDNTAFTQKVESSPSIGKPNPLPPPVRPPMEEFLYSKEDLVAWSSTFLEGLPKTLVPPQAETPEPGKCYPQAPVFTLSQTMEYKAGFAYTTRYERHRQLAIDRFVQSHITTPPSLPPKFNDEEDCFTSTPIAGMTAMPPGCPFALEIVMPGNEKPVISTVGIVHTLDSMSHYPEYPQILNLGTQIAKLAWGTCGSDTEKAIPRLCRIPGLRLNDRAAGTSQSRPEESRDGSYSLGPTLMKGEGQGVVLPALQTNDLEGKRQIATLLSKLNSLVKILKPYSTTKFEHEITDFHGEQMNAVSFGDYKGGATSCQYNVSSTLGGELKDVLGKQGYWHPDSLDDYTRLTFFVLLLNVGPRGDPGPFCLGRYGLFVRVKNQWLLILAFKGNDIHSGFSPSEKWPHFEKRVNELVDPIWQHVGPENRMGFVLYPNLATSHRTGGQNFSPNKPFGNYYPPQTHRTSNLNFVNDGQVALGGREPWVQHMAQELVYGFYASLYGSGMESTIDIQALLSSLKWSDGKNTIPVQTISFHPIQDAEKIKKWWGWWAWYEQMSESIKIHIPRAGYKEWLRETGMKPHDPSTKALEHAFRMSKQNDDPINTEDFVIEDGSCIQIQEIVDRKTHNGKVYYSLKIVGRDGIIDVEQDLLVGNTELSGKLMQLLPPEFHGAQAMLEATAHKRKPGKAQGAVVQQQCKRARKDEDGMKAGRDTNEEMEVVEERNDNATSEDKDGDIQMLDGCNKRGEGDKERSQDEEVEGAGDKSGNEDGERLKDKEVEGPSDRRGDKGGESSSEDEDRESSSGDKDGERLRDNDMEGTGHRSEDSSSGDENNGIAVGNNVATGFRVIEREKVWGISGEEEESEGEEVPEYEVEAILDEKWDNRKRETLYLVKWAGKGQSSSWEPEDNLTNVQDLLAEFESQRSAQTKMNGSGNSHGLKNASMIFNGTHYEIKIEKILALVRPEHLGHERSVMESFLSSGPPAAKQIKEDILPLAFSFDSWAQSTFFDNILADYFNLASNDPIHLGKLQLSQTLYISNQALKLSCGWSHLTVASRAIQWQICQLMVTAFLWFKENGAKFAKNVADQFKTVGFDEMKKKDDSLAMLFQHLLHFVWQTQRNKRDQSNSQKQQKRQSQGANSRPRRTEMLPPAECGPIPSDVNLDILPSNLYGLASIPNEVDLTANKDYVGPASRLAKKLFTTNDLFATAEKLLEDILSNEVIAPKLEPLDTAFNNVHNKASTATGLQHLIWRTTARGGILYALQAAFGSDSVFSVEGMFQIAASPFLINSHAISTYKDYAYHFVKPHGLLEGFIQWLGKHIDETAKKEAQRLGEAIRKYILATQKKVQVHNGPKAGRLSSPIRTPNFSPITQSHLIPNGKGPWFAFLALLMREALNISRELDAGEPLLRRLHQGEPAYHATHKRNDPDHTQVIRWNNVMTQCLKTEFQDGVRLTQPLGLTNLLAWFATGQGHGTIKFQEHCRTAHGGFYSSSLEEMVAKFQSALDHNPPIQSSNMQVWGQACNQLSAQPGIDKKNKLFMTLDQKFSPIFAEEITRKWKGWLGEMIGQDPKNWVQGKKSWSETLTFVLSLKISGVGGLTALQLTNTLALFKIAEMPHYEEISDWIWRNKDLGASAGLEKLGFQLVNTTAVRAAFQSVLLHLEEHMTEDDKALVQLGPMFIEHLLCKVARYGSRLKKEGSNPEERNRLDMLAQEAEENEVDWIPGDNLKNPAAFPFPLKPSQKMLEETITTNNANWKINSVTALGPQADADEDGHPSNPDLDDTIGEPLATGPDLDDTAEELLEA